MTHNGYSGAGGNGNLTIGDYANGMPKIRLSEIPRSFARQLPWMIITLLCLLAASWWFTKDIKRQYVAEGSILVKVGPEHVYDPINGNKQSGINFTADQIALTEVGIIKNNEVLDQVIHIMISDPIFGQERFAPKLYTKWVEAPRVGKVDAWNDIVKYVDKNYVVLPTPKSTIVQLVFKHEDGDVAVKTLDTFITTYQNFRNDIFVAEDNGLISERRAATEEQLDDVEGHIQSLLNRNGISDFEAEQKGAQTRAELLRTQLFGLQGKLSAVEAALAAAEDQLRVTPPTIDLYIDDRGSQRLAQAELERRQLLAKYLPNSNPVRAKEAEIKELRAQIASNGGKPVGGRRVGPNTVYQALMTQRNTYQAQANSYREQEITLQAQLNGAVAKVKKMRRIRPEYLSLLREKTTLEQTLSALNAREQVALVNQQQQSSRADNIKIITRPISPRKGRNMRKIMFALGALGSIFTVFMLALLRVFLDPKLYGPDRPNMRMPVTTSYEYEQQIPESVPVYEPAYESAPEPMHEPVPAYAPAAYDGQGSYEQQPVYDQQYGAPVYDPAVPAAPLTPYERALGQQQYAPEQPAQMYVDPTYADPGQSTGLMAAADPALTPVYAAGEYAVSPVQSYQSVPFDPQASTPVTGWTDPTMTG